jgi:hypothetical protein
MYLDGEISAYIIQIGCEAAHWQQIGGKNVK